MARSASLDLRIRVVEAYLRGEGTYVQISNRFQVGTASVSRWLRIFRQTGDVLPKPHSGGMPPKIDAAGLRWLTKTVEKQPDITLAELADRYAEQTDVTVALSILCRALKKVGLVRKKRPFTLRSAKQTE